MMRPMLSTATILATEGGSEAAAPWIPYAIGAGALGILLFALVGLVAFGAGRDHS